MRSGRHNPNTGFAGVGAEGVTIDTQGFSILQLNAEETIATMGAGLRFGAVQTFMDQNGVAVVSGRNKDVGVAGLLLGSGHPIINSLTGLAANKHSERRGNNHSDKLRSCSLCANHNCTGRTFHLQGRHCKPDSKLGSTPCTERRWKQFWCTEARVLILKIVLTDDKESLLLLNQWRYKGQQNQFHTHLRQDAKSTALVEVFERSTCPHAQ